MTLMAKLLAATLIVGLPIRVEAGAHVAAAKLLFPKEHATREPWAVTKAGSSTPRRLSCAPRTIHVVAAASTCPPR